MSKLNAITLGHQVQFETNRDEDWHLYSMHYAQLFSVWRPFGPREGMLFRQIVAAECRLDRLEEARLDTLREEDLVSASDEPRNGVEVKTMDNFKTVHTLRLRPIRLFNSEPD